jgi:hypothetical protein
VADTKLSGAISELPVPEGGAVAELPRPEVPSPEALDAEAFTQRAGEFRKGLRSATNSLGATVNALAGAAGDAMGLREFATDRYKEAREFVEFSDAVGPRVRDYRAVKDLSDAVDFVAGLGGQAAGFIAPTVAAGAVGMRAAGLRGAIPAAGAASFVPEAGEQVLRTQDSDITPQARLAAAAGKGAGAAALDIIAPVAGLRRVAQAARGAARPSPDKTVAILEGLAAKHTARFKPAQIIVDYAKSGKKFYGK